MSGGNLAALKAAIIKNQKPLMAAGLVGTAGLAYVVKKHSGGNGNDGTGQAGTTGAGSVATGDVVRYDYETTTSTGDQLGAGVPGSKPNRPAKPGKGHHPKAHHRHHPAPTKGGTKGGAHHHHHHPKAQHPEAPKDKHHRRRPLPVRVVNFPGRKRRHKGGEAHQHHHTTRAHHRVGIRPVRPRAGAQAIPTRPPGAFPGPVTR